MEKRGFEHEALLYTDEDEFLSGTVSFIRDAVAAREPIMVAVEPRKIDLLRSHLNGEGERVEFADMYELGRNPALIIPAWREFVDRSTADGRTCRGIGEPIWPGRSEAEIAECDHHESLLNLAFEDGPSWRLLCPYDAAALPPRVLDGAKHNHPVIQQARAQRESPKYRHPSMRAAPFVGALPEPPATAGEMWFHSADDLKAAREFVADRAGAEGLDRGRIDGLVLAVDEVVTNAIRYGRIGGRVRAWAEDGRMVCEVAGGGMIEDPLVGRMPPESGKHEGRGLWIANQFCDLVQIRSSPSGTVVRCHTGPTRVALAS
jgi:anti-sigma regulatory factor (Ser/Thr protein kinase)